MKTNEKVMTPNGPGWIREVRRKDVKVEMMGVMVNGIMVWPKPLHQVFPIKKIKPTSDFSL